MAFEWVEFPQFCNRAKDIRIILWLRSDRRLRWKSTIWIATNNHCDRSRGDCSMTRSRLGQVSDILPAPVFIFSDNWCIAWWTICIAANDQNTVTGWSRGIVDILKQNKLFLICINSWKFWPPKNRSIHTCYHLKMGIQLLLPNFPTYNWEFRS